MTSYNLRKNLEAEGWKLIRELETLHQYRKEGVSYPIVIPDRNDFPNGFLKDLEKKTGLSLCR